MYILSIAILYYIYPYSFAISPRLCRRACRSITFRSSSFKNNLFSVLSSSFTPLTGTLASLTTFPTPDLQAVSLSTLFRTIRDAIKKLPELRKLSSQKQWLFSTDLALVGLGLRTGYLVDVAAPYNAPGVYSNLLEALRQTCGPAFLTVFHLYEPSSEQSFFVNRSLLPRRLASILSEPSTYISDPESGTILFVLLSKDGSPSLLQSSPAALLPIINFLVAVSPSLAPSISLPPYMSQETAVPLAALLLDYPIAYVPCSEEQTNFLSNVPLDVYECRLALELEPGSAQEHTLMKFSCPCAVGEADTELVPRRMQERLRRNFELRMKTLGPSEDRLLRVRVLHSMKTMDRVAI